MKKEEKNESVELKEKIKRKILVNKMMRKKWKRCIVVKSERDSDEKMKRMKKIEILMKKNIIGKKNIGKKRIGNELRLKKIMEGD